MLSLCNTNFSGLKLSEMYGNLCWEFTVGSSLGPELVGARWFYSVRMCKASNELARTAIFIFHAFFSFRAQRTKKEKRPLEFFRR